MCDQRDVVVTRVFGYLGTQPVGFFKRLVFVGELNFGDHKACIGAGKLIDLVHMLAHRHVVPRLANHRSESRLVTGIGLENLVVIETRDAVLIADATKTQSVKELINVLNSAD